MHPSTPSPSPNPKPLQTTQAAGYVGFACGSSAIYTALAMLYQDELGITLPFISPVDFI
jgi:succinate-acetate transporter protein